MFKTSSQLPELTHCANLFSLRLFNVLYVDLSLKTQNWNTLENGVSAATVYTK